MAQTDTVFWFAPPELPGSDGAKPVRLVFHAYDQPATVTVEQPANSFYPTLTFVLPAYGTVSHDLTNMVGLIETTPANTILDRGFRIASTAPITCYYQSISANRETYTLKGRKALGTDFQILAPLNYPSNHPRGRPGFEILATEDSTLVTITTPRWDGNPEPMLEGGIGSDSTFQIRLNRGQSYALRASHYQVTLFKTQIRASHPIAVNMTCDALSSRMQAGQQYSSSSPTYNPAGEQLLPLPYWGTRYVHINQMTPGEMARATDYADSGRLYEVHETEEVGRPFALGWNYIGMVWNVGWPNFHDSVRFFESEIPIGVIHQIDPNSQHGATILPQIDCAGSNQIAYLRSATIADSTPFFIQMIIEAHAVGDILVNGDSSILTANSFRPVPGLPSHAWCNVDMSPFIAPDSVMRVSCSTSKFILSVIESDSCQGTSYTVLTDYAPLTGIRWRMDTSFCSGDSIRLGFNAYNIDSIAIHGPDGLLLSQPPYVIPSADTSMSGTYVIEGFDYDGCSTHFTDSIHITVGSVPTVEISDTVNEDQLPWSRFGTLFARPTDTTLFKPNPAGNCDSVILYHLHVLVPTPDTVLYYACPGSLPVMYGDSLIDHEGEWTFRFADSHGRDSLVIFILTLFSNTDTTIRDTITEDQLPWPVFDTLFTDTVADYIYHTYNEAGCDSIIHYSLFVFWNGDHCDTTLEFPNVVTPNGDGLNDRFVIKGLVENNCFRYNELTIYDRYGHQVYHRRNIGSNADWWDPAAHRNTAGAYFYYFKAHGIHIATQRTGVIEVLGTE